MPRPAALARCCLDGRALLPGRLWVSAGERSASWVIDIDGAGQLHEDVHIAARKAEPSPVLTPIVLGDEAASTVPAAMRVAALAP